MFKILGYIKSYCQYLNWLYFAVITAITAVLIFLNYQYNLELFLTQHTFPPFSGFTGHFLLLLFAFGFPYLSYLFFGNKNYFKSRVFSSLVLICPALFALKMSARTEQLFTNNYYWKIVLHWPLTFLLILICLVIIWKLFFPKEDFFGLGVKNFDWKPYLLMLLIMTPVILIAGTQTDFLAVYPKMKMILPLPELSNTWYHKILFELSYGSDFFTIELFFRGLLVVGFIKLAGKDAIIPMACFYCCIHFGKPLGECISSYFGGILLGIIAFNTRSIWGGIVVHLGIAWMMELTGYFGNTFLHSNL